MTGLEVPGLPNALAALVLDVAGTDPQLPVGIDAETFHTMLHTLTIVLLVYLVRAANR
jgi:hypothetical protein